MAKKRTPKARVVTLYLLDDGHGDRVDNDAYSDVANAAWWMLKTSGLNFEVQAMGVSGKKLQADHQAQTRWPP
jgi:hypothetical protein